MAFRFKLPKVDIFPGREDDLLLIVIGAVALGYVATGVNAWAEDKWTRAAGGTTGALAFLKTGKLAGKRKGHQEGWDEGYATLNPALHMADLVMTGSGFRGGQPDAPNVAQRFAGAVAGSVVQGVAQGVTEQAVEAGVRHMTERFSGSPEPAIMFAPDMPLVKPLQQVADDTLRRKSLERKTVTELKRIARAKGMGGSWLSDARKAQIVDALLEKPR